MMLIGNNKTTECNINYPKRCLKGLGFIAFASDLYQKSLGDVFAAIPDDRCDEFDNKTHVVFLKMIDALEEL